MTILVELNPEMEKQLAAEAWARGIALELYAQRLLQEAIASRNLLKFTGAGRIDWGFACPPGQNLPEMCV